MGPFNQTATVNGTMVTLSFPANVNKKQYEEDLKRRQQAHLDSIQQAKNQNWRPCFHDSCPECLGTGIKKSGAACVHYISCPCPKCSPTY